MGAVTLNMMDHMIRLKLPASAVLNPLSGLNRPFLHEQNNWAAVRVSVEFNNERNLVINQVICQPYQALFKCVA